MGSFGLRGELAVVSAWLSALLPWSVTVIDREFGVLAIRFVFFRIQYLYRLELPNTNPFLWVFAAPAYEGTAGLKLASWVWLGGAAVVALALLLSVAYYAAEERVEALPVDPVRLMGGLLGLAALVHTGALVLFWRHQLGLTVPVGLVVMWLLAGSLLRVERA
ncbi:hypothetical protein VB773_10195 [Haloarculaceae archaeon H-GB2-1]|nr:hypothetical protein [Haloarculaceae archaeon H-GB11]MEA5407892.1 hypothetical protein [Haloarculaceae archaeon H-GB2-1]